MGGIPGAVRKYDRGADGMVPPERELLDKLVRAYPNPVPAATLVTLSTGKMAKPTRVAVVVSNLRIRLGDGWIETTDGGCYRAGPHLLRSRGLSHDPMAELNEAAQMLRELLEKAERICEGVRAIMGRVGG